MTRKFLHATFFSCHGRCAENNSNLVRFKFPLLIDGQLCVSESGLVAPSLCVFASVSACTVMAPRCPGKAIRSNCSSIHATPARLCTIPTSALDVLLRMHGGPTQLQDQNIRIASPLPSPNNFNPPLSSPSAWQVTPTIPTFTGIPIRLTHKACRYHMK